MATWARSRLLCGRPTLKTDRPTRVNRKLFQSEVSMLNDEVFVGLHLLSSINDEPPIAAEGDLEPGQAFGSRPADNCPAGVEHAAMAWAVEAFSCKIHRAAQVCADGGSGAETVPFAEQENAQIRHERRAFGVVFGLESFEPPIRLVQNIGDEEPSGGCDRGQASEGRGAPSQGQAKKGPPLDFLFWFVHGIMSSE